MRKDIELHINTGDTPIVAQNHFTLNDFRWVENSVGLSRYMYGEIDVPHHISEASIRQKGLYVEIPYTPIYKEIMIRVRRVVDTDNYEYIANETNGSNWFIVKTGLYGGEMKNTWASQLIMVSENAFYIKLNKGVAELYSADQSDFNIVNAKRQNANCLLSCNPGNNYRYPLTGVGLTNWINSTNINSTNLAEVLEQEFSADGVLVRRAYYNYDSKQLELDLEDGNI